MLTLNTKIDHAESVFAQLALPYEMRENSRLRTALASGEEVAIFTARGTVLRNNDLLKSDQALVIGSAVALAALAGFAIGLFIGRRHDDQ